MRVTSSYGIEIKHMGNIFLPTAKIYQDALSFCICVFEQEWGTLSQFSSVYQKSCAEHLIHTTKNNSAKYPEFDRKFYKMPIYLLRDVISTALGHLNSYHSLLKNWEDSGCINKKPKLQTHLRKFPTFYKGSMSNSSELSSDTIYLKLYIQNDWKFVPVKLKHTDMQYLRNHFDGRSMSNPTLEKKYGKWFLRFAITEDVELHTKQITNQRALAIDLGINTDATCSVMTSDGTILARKFINFASDKDRIYHCLNKIKKVQQKYGVKGTNRKKLWRYCTSLNTELSRKIAKSIVDYANKMQVDTIVFEHLDFHGKIRGSKKQKLHLWKKSTIQNLVEHKAHRCGMRISRVCAWGTSKLAYDGSGIVLRGKDAGFTTKEICKFTTGKIYNCDLSASYNIGARYFIRELQKSIPATKWSGIVAKVPDCQKRTKCTYATLIDLNREFQSVA